MSTVAAGGRSSSSTPARSRQLKEADTRRDTVQGWLAQGLDPVSELAKLQHPPQPVTFETAAATWKASPRRRRRELADDLRAWVGYWSRVFAGRDPHSLTVADVQRAIAGRRCRRGR